MAETIKGINVIIGAETSGLSKALSDVTKKSSNIRSELKEVEKLLKFDPKNTELLAQKHKLLADRVEVTKERLDRLKSVQEQVNEQFRKGEISEGQYRAFQRELQQTTQQLKYYSDQLKDSTSQSSVFAEKMQEMGSKLQRVGDKISNVGKNLSLKLTAPLAAIGTVTSKSAIDFESAFAGVRKTVDATEEQFKQFEKEIRNMAKEIPQAATEIAGVTEAAGQLGIKKEAIMGFTRTMVDLGVATNMTADQAATDLARLANITQMPQTEFDKLGSTIVALGNNLATTESEIVAMGLRLAGAGAQIGLTEAQIMAFAAALSSVGIEAEAGGSAFSKVMNDMQLAVETSSGRLNEFAAVAGMSAEQFSQAFKEDASSAILAFIQGLGNAEEKGMSAVKILDDMGITEVRLRDALLRAGGASDVFTEALQIGTKAWEENNALTKEAEQRYNTTQSKLQIFKNKLNDVSITLGQALLPALTDTLNAMQPLINGVARLAESFSSLDPKTQKIIISLAGLAAAMGPVMYVTGKVVKVVGSFAGSIGKIALKIKKAGGILTVLRTAFTALTGPVGIAVAAITGITVAGVKFYNHMKQDSIPEVQRFGKEVSASTQQAVGAFLDLNDSATKSLNQLSWSGQKVSQEMATNLTDTFSQMGEQITSGLEEDFAEQLEVMQEFFANSSTISDDEAAETLEKMKVSQEERITAIQEGQARIAEIMSLAAEEKRAITATEKQEINNIQAEMVRVGVQTLSESELEQKAIMERIRANASDLSALQAAEVVQNSVKQKEEAIAAAEEQFDEVVKQIIQQRDEVGSITAEQADMLIVEAMRQKNLAIENATEMHEQIVEQAKLQAEEHINHVDWETGEVLSKWEVFKVGFKEKMNNVGQFFKNLWNGIKTFFSDLTKSVVDGAILAWEGFKTSLYNITTNIKNSVMGVWQGFKDGIIGIWNSIWEGIKNIINKITGAINDMISSMNKISFSVPSWVPGLGGKNFGINMPTIPQLATGGTAIAEGLALVGEMGPELLHLPKGASVIPLDHSQASSGDIIQNITINSPTPLTESETARQFRRASRELALEWGY